jgi:hypothetical protein
MAARRGAGGAVTRRRARGATAAARAPTHDPPFTFG